MPKLPTMIATLALAACSGDPGAAFEDAPITGQAGQAPQGEAGASVAGAPDVAPSAGAAGTGGTAAGAPNVAGAGGLAGGTSSGGAGGVAAGGSAGAEQQAGQGGAAAGSAGTGGTGGQPPQEPNACEPPSQEGPTSGSRDCTGTCASGATPCTGTCTAMPSGGCTGSFMLTSAGADFSVVLEPNRNWTFTAAPGVCLRITAMEGTYPQIANGKRSCFSFCAEEVHGEPVVLKQRGWARAESSAFLRECPTP